MEKIVLVSKNVVVEKILNQKIGLKNSKLENQRRKIGSRKKNLGQKVSVKILLEKWKKLD